MEWGGLSFWNIPWDLKLINLPVEALVNLYMPWWHCERQTKHIHLNVSDASLQKIMDRKKSDHFSKIHHLNRWKTPWNTNSDDSTAGSHLRYLRSLYAFCKHPKLWREKAGWTSFRAGEVSTPRIPRMLRLAHKVLNTLANEPIKSIDTHT